MSNPNEQLDLYRSSYDDEEFSGGGLSQDNNIANNPYLKQLDLMDPDPTTRKQPTPELSGLQGMANMTADFHGNLAWGFTSSASMSTLDLAAMTEGGKALRNTLSAGRYRPWSEQSISGRIGYTIGTAVGFLVPVSGWINFGGKVLKGTYGLGKAVIGAGTGLKGTSAASSFLGKTRSLRIGSELSEEYAEKKSKGIITKLFSEGGDDLTRGLVQAADDVALDPIFSPRSMFWNLGIGGFKSNSVVKGATVAVNEATQELSKRLLKGPMANSLKKLSSQEVDDLSAALISKTIEHNPYNMHKVMETAFHGWGMSGVKGRWASHALSHGMAGFTFHLAEMAAQNGAWVGLNAMGDVDQAALKEEQATGKFLTLPGGEDNNPWGILGTAMKHGAIWSALHIPRVFKGGVGGTRRTEVWEGLKRTVASLKPIPSMSNKEAIAQLGLMDNTMKLFGEKIALRTWYKKQLGDEGWLVKFLQDPEKYGPVARQVLAASRKKFLTDTWKSVGENLGKDIWGSMPRMIAGSTIMSLPNIIDYHKQTGGVGLNAFGETNPEIFANIVIGMLMTKRGDTFYGATKMKNSTWNPFQMEKIKMSYSSNINQIKAMHVGLGVLGIKPEGNFASNSTPASEIIKSHILQTGPMRGVSEVLSDFFVNKVSKEVPGSMPLIEAFKEYINKTGLKEDGVRAQEIENAIKIIQNFKELGVDMDMVLRNVTPEEAFSLVQDLNNLPKVRDYFKKVDVWIENANSQSFEEAGNAVYYPKLAYLKSIHEILGIRVDEDAQGRLILGKANLNDLEPGRQVDVGERAIFREIIDVYETLVKDAVADGKAVIEGEGKLSGEITAETWVQLKQTRGRNEKILSDLAYGKDSQYVGDSRLLVDPTIRIGYREIKERAQVNNILSIFTRDGVKDLDHTIDKLSFDELKSSIKFLNLDKRVKVVGAEEYANKEDADAIMSAYSTLKTIYNLKQGPSDQSSEVVMSINDIKGHLDKFETVFGKEIFTSENLLNRVQRTSFEHFLKSLSVNEMDWSHSTIQALQHILTQGSSNIAKNEILPEGFFARRTPNGYELPSAEVLFRFLSANIKDKDQLRVLNDEVMPFFKEFEMILEGSGNVVKFNNNYERLESIVQRFGGAERVLHFLKTTSEISEKGNVIDVINEGQRIEAIKQNLLNSKNSITQRATDVEQETRLVDHFKSLHTNVRDLGNVVRMAKLTRNYKLLASLGGSNRKITDVLNTIEEFLSMDPTKEGPVTFEYEQKILELNRNAAELLNQQYGPINNQTLTTFLEKEMKKVNLKLEDRQDNMEVNTTPARVESKYGINLNDITIEPHLKLYNETKDVKYLMKVVDNMYKAIEFYAREDITRAKANNTEKDYYNNMMTDIIQIVGGKVFKQTIQTAKYESGILKVREDYMVPHSRIGLSGLDNWLLKGNWFKLDNTFIHTADSGKKYSSREAPEDFDSQLNTAKYQFEYDYERDFITQNLSNELKELMPTVENTANLQRITLGEGTAILVDIEGIRANIVDAFSQGGKLYKELEAIGVDRAKIDEYSSTYGNKNMDQKDIADAVQISYQILSEPHQLLSTQSNTAESKILKRRNLTKSNTGRRLTADYQDWLINAYTYGSKRKHSLSKEFAELYSSIDLVNDRIRSLTIKDEDGGAFSLRGLAKALYEKQGLKGNELNDLLEALPDESVVNSATFVTKKEFMIHLGQLGARPEWFTYNDSGDITGFKLGAIKPKGVHVDVQKNGTMTVYYNKTAFFFNPKIALALQEGNLGHVTFESANKINKHYDKERKELNRSKAELPLKEDIANLTYEDIIIDHIRGHKGEEVHELPYDTYLVSNVSREHLASGGANIGVHLTGTTDLDVWLGVPNRAQRFKDALYSLNHSEYAMAGIVKKLIGSGDLIGDPTATNVPMEYMLNEGNLLLEPFMGDIAVEKLFHHFFPGGKVASMEIPNSSYNVMAPDVSTKLNEMTLPVRKDGRQIIYGHSTISSFEGNQKFSLFGYNNNDKGNTIQEDGQAIGSSVKFKDTNGNIIDADAIVIPQRNNPKKFDIIVAGYRIRDGKAVDMVTMKEVDVEVHNSKRLISDIENFIKTGVLGQVKDGGKTWPTNSEVMDVLPENLWLGKLDVRQPRNSMNDLVITKVKSIGDNVKGNQAHMNFVDAAKTQDADHDFDKSSSYKSAPSNVWTAAAKNAGYELRSNSNEWADSIVKKLELDLSNGKWINDNMNKYFEESGNAQAMRGLFVKLHNTTSYFLNAFRTGIDGRGGDGTIMEFTKGNDLFSVRLKGDAEYRMVVDQIADMVKRYVDSYDNIPDSKLAWEIQQDLLFGNASRNFEGLFEVVQTTGHGKDTRSPYVGDSNADVRQVLMDRFIRPISQYLRYNRGEVAIEGGEASGLKVKDVNYGFKSFLYNFESENGKPVMGYAKEYDSNNKLIKFYDISVGIDRMRSYVTRESSSPFDNMMREVSVAYEASYKISNKGITTVEGLLRQAEAGIMMSRKGLDTIHRNTIDNLWDFVQKDYEYAKFSLLGERIETLQSELAFHTRMKDTYNIDKTTQKILFYAEAKAELEARVASDINYQEGKYIRGVKNTIEKGKLIATTQDIVVWDKNGKIKEVLLASKDGKNRFDIYKNDILIYNGRKFELLNPKKQANLRAKHLAFNADPYDRLTGRSLSPSEHASIIQTAVYDLRGEIIRESALLHKGVIDPAKYAVRVKGLLHYWLQGQKGGVGIVDPLTRKALLWRLLTPDMDLRTIGYSHDHEQGRIYHDKYVDNSSVTKTIHSYLLDVIRGNGFSKSNVVSRNEAHELLTEIASRQTLAHIGITNRDADVYMGLGLGSEYFRSANQNPDMRVNREAMIAARGDVRSEEAMGMINEFIYGDKAMSPIDLFRVAKIVEQTSGVATEQIIEHRALGEKRNFGVTGRMPGYGKTPVEMFREIEKQTKEGCVH